MLQIGKANEVKFKVDVNGTQAPPTVRLVIGVDERELGFKAEKLLGGGNDDWFSEVKIPEDMAAGEYDFRVEVIVNNRLFTPIKRKVMIGNPDPVYVAVSEMATPAHPTQKPKQTETWEGEGGALPEVPEKPQPLPSKPLDPLKAPVKQVKTIASRPAVKGLMREAASMDGTVAHRPVKIEPVKANNKEDKKNTAQHVSLQSSPKPAENVSVNTSLSSQPHAIPTPKLKQISESKPKPIANPEPKHTHTKKSEPVKITMADIAAESAKRFDKALQESQSYRQPCVQTTPISIQHQIPILLVKGDIIYE